MFWKFPFSQKIRIWKKNIWIWKKIGTSEMSIATMKSIMCDITESNIARVNPQVTTFVFGFEGYFRKSTKSLRIVLEELNRSRERKKKATDIGFSFVAEVELSKNGCSYVQWHFLFNWFNYRYILVVE